MEEGLENPGWEEVDIAVEEEEEEEEEEGRKIKIYCKLLLLHFAMGGRREGEET